MTESLRSAAWVPAANGVVWEEIKFHLVRLIWLDTKSLPNQGKMESSPSRHFSGVANL